MSQDHRSRPPRLRSLGWYGRTGAEGMVYRSWMRNQGRPDDYFSGRPIIGICNTWSEFTPCNGHFRQLAEAVKRGVLESGGVPYEFPVMSLGETTMRPTTMMWRNLVSMDVEESIRGNPMDAVVLLTGCDKTTPALLMGAASCDLPTVVVSGGPMLNGRFRGEPVGSGSLVWQATDKLKTGQWTESDVREAEIGMSRSIGHCMTMGTASTMASLVEAMGIALPHNAAFPAADARRTLVAHLAGRRIVQMVKDDVRLSQILTRQAFENAIVTNGAIGGSTNAVVHLLALAGRLNVDLTLADWDKLGRHVPCLVDLQPSGRFLMEDFSDAGGLPAVLRELGDLLNRDAPTMNGGTLWDQVKDAPCHNSEVIRPRSNPVHAQGGLAILRGNLCPDGAVMKVSAASPKLLKHKGRALVFDSIEDYRARIDDPDLAVDASSVLVLRNCGPRGYPGFPEVGNFALPKKLLAQGTTDMLRISDARMSGTAAGTVVLHVAPESAVGGTLALVENGDTIELDVTQGLLQLCVDESTLAKRRAKAHRAPSNPGPSRGYAKLFREHVTQADKGCDFDFLVGGSGADVPARGNH